MLLLLGYYRRRHTPKAKLLWAHAQQAHRYEPPPHQKNLDTPQLIFNIALPYRSLLFLADCFASQKSKDWQDETRRDIVPTPFRLQNLWRQSPHRLLFLFWPLVIGIFTLATP